jgi:hypothetical protein
MAVRAYDGQRFDGTEKAHGDGAGLRIRGKESPRIQMKWPAHKLVREVV